MKLEFTELRNHPALRAGAQFADWERPGVNGNSAGMFIWVAGAESKPAVREIRLRNDAQCIGRLSPLRDTREVLEALCPAHAERARFAHLCINRLILRAEGTIEVVAAEEAGDNHLVGRIEFSGNRPHDDAPRIDVGLAPILIDSLGRSGSTILADSLGSHPAIANFGGYPFEYRFFSYCLHAVYVVTSPANHPHSMGGDAFENRHPFDIGFNPFNHRDYDRLLGHDRLREFYEGEFARDAAKFFMGQARRAIALNAQAKPGAVAFVEKVGGPLLANLAANVCANVREIVLIREFWELALSMIAFDAQRGTSGFFSATTREDADAWLVELALQQDHLRRRARFDGMIAVSYADLMRDPRGRMKALMDELRIETDAAALDAMVKPFGPNAYRRAHSTDDRKRSIEPDAIFSAGAMAEVERVLAT
jgi:hypothetical protein